jgi:hypothetical protein
MAIDPTAVAALVISIVALVIAVAQLLAQVVGTVEGKRRCQESVMGEWAQHTRRRWLWSEFRVETLFTTPSIVLVDLQTPGTRFRNLPIKGIGCSIVDGNVVPSIDDKSTKGIFRKCRLRKESRRVSTELASWVSLLDELDEYTADIVKISPKGAISTNSWPVTLSVDRSWDFMLPEVVRPFATSTVSDLAILTCRLGVVWKEFRPVDGVMEGQSSNSEHVFSATKVRGIGILLTYIRNSYDPNSELLLNQEYDRSRHAQRPRAVDEEKNETLQLDDGFDEKRKARLPLYVWSPDADKLWFGILPGNSAFGLPDLKIGTQTEIEATLLEIDHMGVALHSLQEMQKKKRLYLHGFCDIIPMYAPWLCAPHSPMNWHPHPIPNQSKGLTWNLAGIQAFKAQLDQYNASEKATAQTRWVTERYDELQSEWPVAWAGHEEMLRSREAAFVEHLRSIYDQTTAYFVELQHRWDLSQCNIGDDENSRSGTSDTGLSYMNLVVAHVREAPRSLDDAEQWVLNDSSKNKHNRDWRWRAMECYWNYMPQRRDYMRSRDCEDASLVADAWVTLLFRAFLWQRAHIAVDVSHLLPSQFYGSQLPVCIG